MTKQTIGTNASVIWRLLANNKTWECNELKEASGLSNEELFTAIGWLAKEGKIQIEKKTDNKLYLTLPFNIFYY